MVNVGNIVGMVPKRIRIILATMLMVFVLTLSSFFNFTTTWYIFIPILLCVSYLTTYLAIYEDIDGVEWYMLFIMPILLTLAFYLFYSLFPVRWLTRLPFIVLFALGYYAMLLTSNIFNVGVIKSIQLYRAAFSINYLTQSLVIFMLILVSISFRFNFFINAFLTGCIAFLLSLQGLWTVRLNVTLNTRVLMLSVLTAVLMIEVSLLLSFIPMHLNIATLTMTAFFYSMSGLLNNYLDDRLFNHVIREYVFVVVFVLIIAVLTIQW